MTASISIVTKLSTDKMLGMRHQLPAFRFTCTTSNCNSMQYSFHSFTGKQATGTLYAAAGQIFLTAIIFKVFYLFFIFHISLFIDLKIMKKF